MSGSLTQEGDVDLSGSVNLALPGQTAAVRGGLTVVEDALFSSMLQVDGTLDCNSTSDFQGNANFQAKVTFNGAQAGKVTSVTSATIDGVASIILESPHAGVTLVCNGSAWFVL